VCCIHVEAPEADGQSYETPCSWASIISALRQKLAELPADHRGDLEAFIELLEGLAELDEK
jgi:hypothetical protein